MQPNRNNRGKWETKFPTFFANMGKSSKEELVNFTYYEDISVEIICFYNDLKNHIKDIFPEFIFKTNFGTRQSKGFGSFYISEDDEKR